MLQGMFHLFGGSFFFIMSVALVVVVYTHFKEAQAKEKAAEKEKLQQEANGLIVRRIASIAAQTNDKPLVDKVADNLMRAGNNTELLRKLEEWTTRQAHNISVVKQNVAK